MPQAHVHRAQSALPEGWTGNAANHHRDFGIFRVTVMRWKRVQGGGAAPGWWWQIGTPGILATHKGDSLPNAADARAAALAAFAALLAPATTYMRGYTLGRTGMVSDKLTDDLVPHYTAGLLDGTAAKTG